MGKERPLAARQRPGPQAASVLQNARPEVALAALLLAGGDDLAARALHGIGQRGGPDGDGERRGQQLEGGPVGAVEGALPAADPDDELADAVLLDRPPRHDGAWGRATLEACLAILESARRQADVALRHQ